MIHFGAIYVLCVELDVDVVGEKIAEMKIALTKNARL